MRVPLSKPALNDQVNLYVSEALKSEHLQGSGPFTERCHSWLEEHVGGKPLLTHSCTAALEMAMLLANICPGDEVIMPSFTFVATASAAVATGGVPVFVDVCADTCNLDPTKVEAAITKRTKAIAVVHYAGVCCDMDAFRQIADKHKLILIEDAAQALGSTYKGQPAGTLSDLGCFSFHETKNVISGEGGALIVNDKSLNRRAAIIRDKGTNREEFLAGETHKYTWLDKGSSYLPSDIIAAILLAQLEASASINSTRLGLWDQYHSAFEDLETTGKVQRPSIPKDCGHNAHIYYLRLGSAETRNDLLQLLRDKGIGAAFHYVPLHSSPAGVKFGRTPQPLPVTDQVAATLLRLPMYPSLTDEIGYVINTIREYFER